MQRESLRYNLYPQIIICFPCNTTVPFNEEAPSGHFSDPKTIHLHAGYKLSTWKQKRVEQFIAKVKESLQSLDQMQGQEIFIRSIRKEIWVFKPEAGKPVSGIYIYPG